MPTFSLRNPESATAYTYFSLLFNDDLLNHIANQTNLYARVHAFCLANYQWLTLKSKNLGHLGIISTGYVSLPNFVDHWETNSVFCQPGIVKGMSHVTESL